MITISANTITLRGHLTMLNVSKIYAQGVRNLTAGAWQIDCSQVELVDSSAVALLLGWLRAAQATNCQLSVQGLPRNVLSLASLYGVESMLPTQLPVANQR